MYSDVHGHIILYIQMLIPNTSDTTYWCLLKQLPADVMQTTHFITRVRA